MSKPNIKLVRTMTIAPVL